MAQWQIEGENVEAVIDFLFLSSKITVYGACSHETGKQSLLGRKTKTKLDCVKKQRHHFANKDMNGQGYGLSSNHAQLWELEHKEGRAPKNWHFWREDSWESLGQQGNQPWILIGRTDAEAPIFWSPDVNSQLIGKDPDSGKEWRQRKRG